MTARELPPSRSPWKMVEGPNRSVVFVNPEHPAMLLLGGWLQVIDAGRCDTAFVQDRMFFAEARAPIHCPAGADWRES